MNVDTPLVRGDLELVDSVRAGADDDFEELIRRYQARVFGTARRYARRESEVEDIVQEVFVKAFRKLHTFRADAPFEHWIMRLTVRTCFDFLRSHQRSREIAVSDQPDLPTEEILAWVHDPRADAEHAAAARVLVQRLLEKLKPAARLVITLLEIEERSIKEIAQLTGWSIPVVKIRAFRARAEMKRQLAQLNRDLYL